MLYFGGNRDNRVEIGAELNALQDTAHFQIVSANYFGTTFGQGSSWVDPRRMVLFLRGYFYTAREQVGRVARMAVSLRGPQGCARERSAGTRSR